MNTSDQPKRSAPVGPYKIDSDRRAGLASNRRYVASANNTTTNRSAAAVYRFRSTPGRRSVLKALYSRKLRCWPAFS